jgi:uncharacterized membrane protein YbhN (UPF0104 family)
MPATEPQMPDDLSPRHLRARLIELGALVAVIVGVIGVAPGLGSLRDDLRHASPAWILVAALLEVLSMLSYVVIFRSVFCPRMTWRLSYQIGMAEQAANALLPAGGAGGLALGAWALSRAGMGAGHIARRTVAFFLLTSLANVGTVILFAVLFATGALGADPAPAVTFAFGVGATAAIALVLALPSLSSRWADRGPLPADAGRIRVALRTTRDSLADGVREALALLERRQVGVIVGSLGYMAFDLAVLGACFAAIGHSLPLGVLVMSYLIGQLGGLIPIPGGIGGTEAGLIGVLALYHAPLAAATVAVLIYRAIQLWIPAVLGTVAFVQLRATLRREPEAAAICQPLAEPLEKVQGGLVSSR